MSKRPVTSIPAALILLSLTHLLSDTQQGLMPIILLYQQPVLGLSLGQIGLIAGAYNLVISLAQPLFGYLADVWGQGRLIVLGFVWVALLGSMLGLAPSAGLLLLCASLAALGPAAFHPSGAASVGRIRTTRPGVALSIFFVGGTLGHAMGPLVGSTVFDRVGLQGTIWIAAGILVAAIVVLSKIPFARHDEVPSPDSPPEPSNVPSTWRQTSWIAVIALLSVTAIRTWLQLGLATYLPQKLVQVGLNAGPASRGLSLMQASVALGVLVGGPLIDRFGPRVLTASVLAVLCPVIVVLARSATPGVLWIVPLAGVLTGVPLSMTFVIGQSMLPSGKGLASGLLFATSSIAGAAGVALTGSIAQHAGLATSLTILGFLPLLGVLASMALPRPRVGLQVARTG